MKTFYLSISLLLVSNIAESQCTSTLITPVTINGDMSDWATILQNPSINVYDYTGSVDLDAPIADKGRDITRFAYTEDISNLYIFLERAGSVNNSVDIAFYVDVNNNSIMESNEPVVKIGWGGSNGNTTVAIYNYIPSLIPSGNSISGNGDGHMLLGALAHRESLGNLGEGSVDGKSTEVRIPFNALTIKNSQGQISKQLSAGDNFTFHVSTINGNVSSVPNANSINDNFGGCLSVPVVKTLPVKLTSFTAILNNAKAELNWKTVTEESLDRFIVERSTDGIGFNEAALVFAAGNSFTEKNYSITDNLAGVTSPVIYYRLRIIDIDGKNELSETRMLKLSKSQSPGLIISAYPNPAAGGLHITNPAAWQKKNVTYEIFSLAGQLIAKKTFAPASQTETADVSKLQPGVYIIKAECNGETAIQKIIKQ